MRCLGTFGRPRFARAALLAAAISTSSASAIVHAQKKPPLPPTAGAGLLGTTTYEQRIKAAQDRRQRELDLGLAEEAAQTARDIEALRREQQQKCGGIWTLLEQVSAGKDMRAALRMVKEYRDHMNVIVECGQRPGTTEPADAASDVSPFDEQTMLRNQFANQDGAVRAPLFIAPVLSTATDATVPGPLFGDISPAGTAVDNAALRDTAKLYAETSRLGRDYEGARALLESALAAAQSPGTAGSILEMLRLYDQQRGDTSGALGRTQAQLAVYQRAYGADSPRLCFPLWQSIPLFLDAGAPDRALDAAERCLAAAGPPGTRPLTYASALNNLALVYHRVGELGEAIDRYEKASAVLAPITVTSAMAMGVTDPTRQPPHINVHANLGLAYWQQGDLARAARHFEAARAQMSREDLTFITERSTVDSLAQVEAEVDALLTLERQMAQAAPGPPPLLALPLVLERKGLALDGKASAVRMFGKDSGDLREYRSLLAYRARLARGTPAAAADLLAMDHLIGEAEFQIQSLEYQARSRAFTSALMGTTTSAEYAKYMTALAAEQQKVAADEYKHRSKNDRRSAEEIEADIERAARAKVDPQFKNVVAAQNAITQGVREELLARVQARLPDSAVLLEMLRFRPLTVGAPAGSTQWQPARYGAYVVKHTGAPLFIDFGESDPIDDLIAEFRRTLAQPRGTLVHELGRRLDSLLMQPVRMTLGRVTTIYLSPDGPLNLVPFAALVDENDRYLIETLTFDYVSSGRDLLRSSISVTSPASGPVVVGDPAFDGVDAAPAATVPVTRGLAGRTFDRLPATATEAQAIAAVLGQSTVLTGTNATETAVKAVQAPRVLHIATHGFFLADQDLSTAITAAPAGLEDPMLRSGLVLAGANIGKSGNDDGVLTAFEAAGLSLSGTQLVVLSACETGVGEVKTGEGVFGLRRAFTVAGAETLVMSLWQVEDSATQQLMVEFYKRLSTGQGRAEALRQAALMLLHDPATRHPFYWASFIASGEPGPLHR